jgi:ribosome-binding protein aMBF1 (putative translation factor)
VASKFNFAKKGKTTMDDLQNWVIQQRINSQLERAGIDPNSNEYRQERLVLDVTEIIAQEKERQGLSYKQLAKKLGMTKKRVKKLMSGERDMTIRQFSDFLTVFGLKIKIETKQL